MPFGLWSPRVWRLWSLVGACGPVWSWSGQARRISRQSPSPFFNKVGLLSPATCKQTRAHGRVVLHNCPGWCRSELTGWLGLLTKLLPQPLDRSIQAPAAGKLRHLWGRMPPRASPLPWGREGWGPAARSGQWPLMSLRALRPLILVFGSPLSCWPLWAPNLVCPYVLIVFR